MMGSLQLIFAVACAVSLAAGQAYGEYNCQRATWGTPIFDYFIQLDSKPIPADVVDYTVKFQLPIGCDAVAAFYDVCGTDVFTVTVVSPSTIAINRPHHNGTPASAKMAFQCVVPPHNRLQAYNPSSEEW